MYLRNYWKSFKYLSEKGSPKPIDLLVRLLISSIPRKLETIYQNFKVCVLKKTISIEIDNLTLCQRTY